MTTLFEANTLDVAELGDVVKRIDIKSSLQPIQVLLNYITVYPNVVIRALADLYQEYNHAFVPLIEENREWATDYQYCQDGISSANWCVQIDVNGLTDAFLQELADMSKESVHEILRRRIFEIENSIAVYQLLEKFFARNGNDSFFKIRFRAVLNDLRQRFNKPIALLAVTEGKYDAMFASEFGKRLGEQITKEEIKELSGFDVFFGPGQFREYLTANGGQCGYLLYVRSSDPVAKLKKPGLVIEHPLLGDADMRRIIKAHSLTLNIDAPGMEYERRINDTKDYMPLIGMAFPIGDIDELSSATFKTYITEQGIDLEAVAKGEVALRCKPAKCAYGCFGHVSGVLTDGKFRRELRRGLRQRGDYVVQPEMETPVITNMTDQTKYTFIDRIFFGIIGGQPEFLGGVRNLMPTDNVEARRGRIHGNGSAVYAEIIV